MGYFNKEDLENKEVSYDREDIEQNKQGTLKNFSSEKDKLTQQSLELEKKNYFARYGNKKRDRLYEYEAEQEETDDLKYGR